MASISDKGYRTTKQKSKFIPLKDLLTKNHDDRVKDYLNKMKGLTTEQVVDGGSFATVLSKTVQANKDEPEFGTVK